MSKILFINGNLHGHINPTLPVVKELVLRGEEVYYFSTKEFQLKLEAVGATFMDYGDKLDHFLHSFHPHGSHPFYTLMEYMLGFDRIVIPIILHKIEGMTFDLIIHDVMFGGGNIVAEQLGLPSIASCSSFVIERPPLPSWMLESGYDPQLDLLLEDLSCAKSEWGMSDLQLADVFFKKANKVLVYTSRLFQPMGDRYDESFCFIGPSIIDRQEVLEFPLNQEQTILYISLGTIVNNRCSFYQMCIEAFQDTNYQVVMSVGNKTDISSLGEIPKNFIVRNYIPQLEVLQHASLFISHGGLNSVSESIWYGVPVIAVPMANDQPAVAKRLSELGAGIVLNMTDLNFDYLRKTADAMISDSGYKDNCKIIQHSFVASGGYQKAVEEILKEINK